MWDEGFYGAGKGEHATSFHCLVGEWKDCEELKPLPKEKFMFVDKNRKQSTDKSGVLQLASIGA